MLQRPQDAEKVLTLDCVMDEQTETFHYHYYVSIFCFTSFNTFWKYLWLGKLDEISLCIKFCFRDFFFSDFVWNLKDIFWFWFWFCSSKRLKNRAWVLGQNSIFNYREHWEYFYLAGTSQVKFELYNDRFLFFFYSTTFFVFIQ